MRPDDGGASEALRRRAAEAFADAEAADLVAEARTEARARVRSILVDAMTEALLERASAEFNHRACEPSPGDVVTEASDKGNFAWPSIGAGRTGDLGWYVYCVVNTNVSELRGAGAGVADGHPVCLVTEGELAAVVSQVPLPEFDEEMLHENLNDHGWLERTARAHHRVLDEVGAETTVIPMRLCTIYRSEDSVRQLLIDERTLFTAALARLTGKTEWGVKVSVETAVLTTAAAEADSELARLEADLATASPGAAYLRHKQAERLRADVTARLVEACVDDVHARLSQLAVEASQSSPPHHEPGGHSDPVVLNAAYLIEAGATDDFRACVAELAAEVAPHGFALEATGPWPPYNFAGGVTHAA